MAEVETIEARRYRDEVEPCSPVSTSSTFSLSSVDSLWADEMDKHDAKTGKAYDDDEDEKFKMLDEKEWIQDGIDSVVPESSYEPAYEAESEWYPNQLNYMDDFSLAINPFAMPYYYYPGTYQQVYPDEYYYHDGQQYTDEDLLAASLVELLSDPNVNPYNGSVALERLQNLIRYRLPELYAKVIGSRGAAWRAFVERRSEFSMIQVESRPRVRLSSNHEWAAGDRQEQIVRRQSEHHLLICLQSYLESVQDKSCQVDEFMQVYPTLPQNQTPNGPPFPLPERGDFVRFVRRHPTKFTYVKEGYRIFIAGAETE